MAGQRQLSAEAQSWPIAGSFTISRGSKTAADVVVASVSDGEHTGRGECVPYARYGETVEGVLDVISGIEPAIAEGLTRNDLQTAMPAGAARNAVDCALWDLEARQHGTRAWTLAGFETMRPLTTAYTLSLDTPEAMAQNASNAAARPLLKLKLGGDGDADRLRAVHQAAPQARLIVDANEAWRPEQLEDLMAVCLETGVELVEQPLPADRDDVLGEIQRPVTVCADESVHGLAGFETLIGKYDAVNIKLDKTGGLTEALALADAATVAGMSIMVGCMLATSLAMAPAMIVAQKATVVDLDGPLLLAEDRDNPIQFDGSIMAPPPRLLWG